MNLKKRLDVLLVERGLASSREKAQALILAGNVLVNNEPAEKVGLRYGVGENIRVRGEVSKFVGRGGDKIEPAFEFFGINLNGVVALDVGASTGGFTDCMLQRGAKMVYAVDVGYNQLAHKLRTDARVVVYEKTHAKDLARLNFKPQPEFATIDVSFIGVRKVLGYVVELFRNFEAQPYFSIAEKKLGILALVKPQFELGQKFISKGGVVKEEQAQLEAVKLVQEYAQSLGLVVANSFACPLRGEKSGNQEYFLYM
ncbi:MAG: TlyA family RNA methyltransferase [Deltaproteobacteria bacterium]|jgi:23S rRNA (cytidine1920-2'-O)/16S rRNA (cytidine1409-2'-O)-methyltransferase|nr:TlyA family RNA methyltransferase [Deltaproteobacteria bacterium]